jgi:hypothetical protein
MKAGSKSSGTYSFVGHFKIKLFAGTHPSYIKFL